jgi:lysophospholipase L1-like esterase
MIGLARPSGVAVSAIAMACVAAAIGLSACGSTSPRPSSAGSKSSPTIHTDYYVSLGDSYAAGYEVTGTDTLQATTSGYANQLPSLASAKGYQLGLVNFGCGGATTSSMLKSQGCAYPSVGAASYPHQTQAAAAEAFLTRHRGKIGLITVSLGGNDFASCLSHSDLITCAGSATTAINANLTVLLPALRSAAGPNVPIIGITYPDTLLAGYLSTVPTERSGAEQSVSAFRDLINPALQQAYDSIGSTFIDVTSATGAYTPFSQTTRLAGYGTLPVAVAQVCELTFACQYGDVHPRTAGYTEIAKLIVAALPNRL